MSVVQAMEEIGPCRKQLTIEVPLPAVEAETERVVGLYRREAKLPGYRPGKAPKALVRRRFGEEIKKEVADRLVPRYWHQAEAEKQLDPLLPPALESLDFELGGGLTFKAVVEVRPEIELGTLEGFDLPEKDTAATDEDVERQLEDLRRRAGSWNDVERPAARGDQVLGEILREGDEEPRRVTLEVGDERVWEELTLAVTGLAPGQQSSFERAEGDENHSYTVTVETVQELDAAPLDDELAAKVSQFETLDELREQIEQSISDAKAKELRRLREMALLDQLRERHPLQLPQAVVDQDLESMVRDYAHSLASQGLDIEKAEIDWGQIAEQMRPQAEKAVHARLVLDAVAEARQIVVPEEKLEAMLAGIAQARKSTPLSVRRELDSSGRLPMVRRQLRREATIGSLLDEPTEVDSAADTAADDEAASNDGGD